MAQIKFNNEQSAKVLGVPEITTKIGASSPTCKQDSSAHVAFIISNTKLSCSKQDCPLYHAVWQTAYACSLHDSTPKHIVGYTSLAGELASPNKTSTVQTTLVPTLEQNQDLSFKTLERDKFSQGMMSKLQEIKLSLNTIKSSFRPSCKISFTSSFAPSFIPPFMPSLWSILGSLLIIAVLYLVVCCNYAEAAPSAAPQVTFEEAMNRIVQAVRDVHSTVQDVSQKILASLVAIGLVCFGAKLFSRSQEIFTRFNIGFIYLILLFGCFNFFIVNGDKIARDVINSFIMLGANQVQSIGFSDIFNNFFQLVDAFSNLFINQESLIFVLGLIVMYAILSLFLVNFALIYITSIFISCMGIFSFAFAFNKSMRFIAMNYVKLVLGYGIKMFTLYLIFFVGIDVFELLLVSMTMKVSAGQLITVQELGLTIFVLFFFLQVSRFVPDVMMGLVK